MTEASKWNLFGVRNTRTDTLHEVLASDARQAKHIICVHFPATIMSELKVSRRINLENKTPRMV